MTKVEAIRKLMLDNGGVANLKMIYSQIENYYPNAKTSKEWQAGLRGVLYRDLDKSFKKIKDGIYAVIEYDEYNNLPYGLIDITDTEEVKIQKVRKLQSKFKRDLLKVMPFCPITKIADKRLLIASHIKPWCFSDANERIDINNGFIFSPLYDKLFDSGLITFSDDKWLVISPTLDSITVKKLNIKEQKYTELVTFGREEYLEFHRQNIFIG